MSRRGLGGQDLMLSNYSISLSDVLFAISLTHTLADFSFLDSYPYHSSSIGRATRSLWITSAHLYTSSDQGFSQKAGLRRMLHCDQWFNSKINKSAIFHSRLTAFCKLPPSVKPSVQSRKLCIFGACYRQPHQAKYCHCICGSFKLCLILHRELLTDLTENTLLFSSSGGLVFHSFSSRRRTENQQLI